MAYRKVCDTQGGPMVGEVLHCSGALDLDWDLDKEELQEPGPSMDRMQMQHIDCQRSGKIAWTGAQSQFPITFVPVKVEMLLSTILPADPQTSPNQTRIDTQFRIAVKSIVSKYL